MHAQLPVFHSPPGWQYMSNGKDSGCLGFTGDYSIQLYQLYRDFNKTFIGIPIKQPV